ncbi:MAG TPA: hypothetical protein VGK67_03380 [Myxococcales bacterium]
MLIRTSLALLVGALALAAAPRAARACGPSFPVEALSLRDATLAELPDGIFSQEILSLLPKPSEPFKAVDASAEPTDARDGGGEQERSMYREGVRVLKAAGKPKEIEQAFQQILDLPETERKRFGPMAAYTLARVGNKKKSAERLLAVREMVKKGDDDPLGLAVASYGEEAKALLEAGKDAAAVKLYAVQAGFGSRSGINSLLAVARALAKDEARLKKAVGDPLVQGLLTTWLWTRGTEAPDGVYATLAALPAVTGADRLAAAAWRAGKFEMAEQFAAKEKTPLALWVQAKLAVRKGDKVAAEALLEEASRAFPPGEDWQGAKWMPRERIESELTILALARGDQAAAMKCAIDSCSWPDIAYLAERVLTIDELKELVDRRRGSGQACRTTPVKEGESFPGAAFAPKSLDAALKALLARRMMRAGRDDARALFESPRVMKAAGDYLKVMDRASGNTGVDKAQALFDASRIVRQDGLDLFGTELGPDWVYVAAAYDVEKFLDKPAGAPQQKLPEAEAKRVAESKPPNALRYHYRSTAADLAEQAAKLLPPRSQAYAAAMCHAARYVRNTDPARFRSLFRTYQKNGPFLKRTFAKTFGYTCPDPKFVDARSPKKAKEVPLMKRYRKRTMAAAGGGVLLLLVGLGAVIAKRIPKGDGKGKGKDKGKDKPDDKTKSKPPPGRVNVPYQRPGK